MNDAPIVQNSLAWVHFRLRGGWRSTLLQSGGFLVAIGGLILLSVRSDPNELKSILYGWVVVLLALQLGILLLYGGSAVRNAVRKDVTTGMIASHRLMPISPWQAVAGYVIGACPQVLALALANLLIGILIAGPGGLSPADWVAANALLLLFAVCSWVVIACASLISAKSAGAVLIAIILIAISGGFLLTLIPAFTVICSPLVGSTVFGIVMRGAAWSDVLHLSIMAQLTVTALCYVAAARRYRRDDVLAFSPPLGMLALAVFATISLLGIRNWASLQPMISQVAGDLKDLQALGSMSAGMLLAFVPISAAAWLQEDYRRRKAFADPALGRKPSNCVLLAIVSAGLIVLIPALTLDAERFNLRLLSTFACLAVALIPVAYWFRLIYRTRASAGMLLALWIVLTWVGPWVVSFGVLVAHGLDKAVELPDAWGRSELVASFSPVGALISIWNGNEMRYLPGLAGQAILAAAIALFYHTRPRGAANSHVPVPGGK